EREITAPPQESSDWFPAFSPDGKSVAFIRSNGPGLVDDVYVVPSAGGDARRLTFDRREVVGPVWTADGGELIFASGRGGLLALWRIPATGGTPERVGAVGAGGVGRPAVAQRGQRLAYEVSVWKTSFLGVEVREPGRVAGAPKQILTSK